MEVHVFFSFSGYIIEVDGPHMGANSDSQITKHIITAARLQVQNIASWLRPGDIVIVDRGFYDAVEFLQDMGIDVRSIIAEHLLHIYFISKLFVALPCRLHFKAVCSPVVY